MKARPHEAPMEEPLAIFLTWVTYGTWLPGDPRGWVRRGKGWQVPDPVVHRMAEQRMAEPPCMLDRQQRRTVEKTVAEHCAIRGWQLHAVRCRTNHVHVVVSANCKPETVRHQLKAWCTRKLKELARSGHGPPDRPVRKNWWAERGSIRLIGDEESLEVVVRYVVDAQDRKDRDAM